jgi:L-lysine exporter family protein LysE/ArgO
MWHSFIAGLLLGWGASIPLGPMNIEIIRRHLLYGFRFGFSFGIGAALSDLTYFVIVYAGFMQLLSDHHVMRWVGYVSIAALLYFAITALFSKAEGLGVGSTAVTLKKQSAWHHGIVGYGYTLLNPYTIIFWVAVGAQLAALRSSGLGQVLALGSGIVLAIFAWVAGLSVVLHHLKRRISPQWMQRINYIGAICLFAFIIIIGYELWVKRVF